MDRQRTPGQANDGEVLKWFWVMKNMLDFENIGFTHAVLPAPDAPAATVEASILRPSYKYLTCADCEISVLGKIFIPFISNLT
jgi:hypothetical protein